MVVIGTLLLQIIEFYTWIVIGMIIFSWLLSFKIIPPHHQAAQGLMQFFDATVNRPVLNHIRKFMPDMGPLDFSPIVLFIILRLLMTLIATVFFSQAGGATVILHQ